MSAPPYKYNKHDERKHARQAQPRSMRVCRNCGDRKPQNSFSSRNGGLVCKVCVLSDGLNAVNEYTSNKTYLKYNIRINGQLPKQKFKLRGGKL